ncbi:unnamed protein product [Porites lobata]|uniref:Uncharacterized protein n=1 Tax=Porites lobata TaxID=104759 RepID=A0ABN8N5N4_9CNID|nr:unnamed protein product [Porites lobata]
MKSRFAIFCIFSNLSNHEFTSSSSVSGVSRSCNHEFTPFAIFSSLSNHEFTSSSSVSGQIFEKRTIGYLNEEEENLFMTQRTFDSFCRSCSSSVTLNSSILLTVVTAYGLNQLGLDNNMWPIFVTQMHTNPGRLNCTNCHTQTSEPVLRNVLNSHFLFIEFSPALMKDINVFEEIEISGAQYKLRGVVRCHNNHFTCAVKDHSACKWT